MRRKTVRSYKNTHTRPPLLRQSVRVDDQPVGASPPPDSPPGSNEQLNYEVIMNRLGTGRSWTPWLLLRFAQTDMGWRPIPAADAFYLSPDIWVQSSDPSGNAVPGEPNFVYAAILNLGKAPALPTRVDFYWGNPAIGLGPGQMHLIGSE